MAHHRPALLVHPAVPVTAPLPADRRARLSGRMHRMMFRKGKGSSGRRHFVEGSPAEHRSQHRAFESMRLRGTRAAVCDRKSPLLLWKRKVRGEVERKRRAVQHNVLEKH